MTARSVPWLAGAALALAVSVTAMSASAGPTDGAAAPTAQAVRLSLPTGPTVGGCRVFPTNSPWNTNISKAPLHPRSARIIASIQAHGGTSLHPDFGQNPDYGIPYQVVPSSQANVPIAYDAYGDESDPGPFPLPLSARVEAGSDRHVLVVQQGRCRLFELYDARRRGAGWVAASGASFDLSSNALRPLGWTSADAAGLPILPGLVRYDEVAAGRVQHAIRVTFSRTQAGFVLPATHQASSVTDVNAPPMGLRLRLKASYSMARFTGQAKVIATAMQRYGLIVADNGSNWFFQGGTDSRWNDAQLDQLKSIPGTAFEVVDTGPVQHR
jgi:hypothetical protein